MEPKDKFCSACATRLQEQTAAGRRRPVCPNCQRVVFYNPKVVAVTIIERDGQVLMMRRAGAPRCGLWSIPGGYVDRGETVEGAAAREALEETGLVVRIERLIGLFSEVNHPVIVAAFTAVKTGGALEAGPEALEVGFFYPDALPPLAFPKDKQLLERWRQTQDHWIKGA